MKRLPIQPQSVISTKHQHVASPLNTNCSRSQYNDAVWKCHSISSNAAVWPFQTLANTVYQHWCWRISVTEVLTRWNWNDCSGVCVESAIVFAAAPTLVDVADCNTPCKLNHQLLTTWYYVFRPSTSIFVVSRLRRSETLYEIWAQSGNPCGSYCSLNFDLMTLNMYHVLPLCPGIVCTKFKLSQVIRSWNVTIFSR